MCASWFAFPWGLVIVSSGMTLRIQGNKMELMSEITQSVRTCANENKTMDLLLFPSQHKSLPSSCLTGHFTYVHSASQWGLEEKLWMVTIPW